MRPSTGCYNYAQTRWYSPQKKTSRPLNLTHVNRTCIAVNVFNYSVQAMFILVFFVTYYTTDVEEEHPGLIYIINLTFFSFILIVLLTSFLAFAILIWRLIVTSGGKEYLLGELFKVLYLNTEKKQVGGGRRRENHLFLKRK